MQADDSQLLELEKLPTLADGFLQKKGCAAATHARAPARTHADGRAARASYNTGRWNKRWFVLKRGYLLYFASDKEVRGERSRGGRRANERRRRWGQAAEGLERRKGAFLLSDCHIVQYAKEKRDMHTFGVESKNACMWLGAEDEHDEERWFARFAFAFAFALVSHWLAPERLAALDSAIIHTTAASDAASKSIDALFQVEIEPPPPPPPPADARRRRRQSAASSEQETTKLVRLKGGTMLVSREAGSLLASIDRSIGRSSRSRSARSRHRRVAEIDQVDGRDRRRPRESRRRS